MAITAIIVTYNSAGVIETALRCLCGHPQIAECIVVDNASQDDTVALIHARFPQVKILQNPENRGFGNACNQALEKVGTEFALLFNPDAVMDEQGISTLKESFSLYPNAAVIAPLLEGADHERTSHPLHLRGRKNRDSAASSGIILAEFISGAIAMWRMEYMREVGFFDPVFFLFYEDDDISLRVRKAGYDLVLINGINAKHASGTSCHLTRTLEDLKLRSLTWSYLYIYRKYHGRIRTVFTAINIIRKQRRLQRECVVAFRHLCIKPWHQALLLLEARLAEGMDYLSAQQDMASKCLMDQQAVLQRIHERNSEMMERAHDVLWGQTIEKEGYQESLAAAHEEKWRAIVQGLEDELLAGMKVLEERHTASMQRIERGWKVVIARYEEERAFLLDKIESEVKLHAALDFLCNPKEFKK